MREILANSLGKSSALSVLSAVWEGRSRDVRAPFAGPRLEALDASLLAFGDWSPFRPGEGTWFTSA
eukprot:CAMPEP_0181509054 /NCGR_PEP_ID=MMETSP1110-20121109/60122_1 /TAXON_ID=174948 /ORGANISM="Symbiodinium sp., Strain CCMP421" /LENGTH=65 /DNA_ID=CAMNT_0023638551 /DNA_START=84 /DNA_END=281 /DNA_ORIENTATION=+